MKKTNKRRRVTRRRTSRRRVSRRRTSRRRTSRRRTSRRRVNKRRIKKGGSNEARAEGVSDEASGAGGSDEARAEAARAAAKIKAKADAVKKAAKKAGKDAEEVAIKGLGIVLRTAEGLVDFIRSLLNECGLKGDSSLGNVIETFKNKIEESFSAGNTDVRTMHKGLWKLFVNVIIEAIHKIPGIGGKGIGGILVDRYPGFMDWLKDRDRELYEIVNSPQIQDSKAVEKYKGKIVRRFLQWVTTSVFKQKLYQGASAAASAVTSAAGHLRKTDTIKHLEEAFFSDEEVAAGVGQGDDAAPPAAGDGAEEAELTEGEHGENVGAGEDVDTVSP